MESPVLIVSNSKDPHADIVEKKLRESGEDVFRFDTDKFAVGETFIALSDKEPNTLWQKGQSIALDSIKSVWYRRPEDLKIPLPQGSRELKFAKDELQALLDQLYYLAPKALWVSPVLALRKARQKYHQLQTAKSLGFMIPRTLMTNSPEKAKQFIESCTGRAIYKTLNMPAIMTDEQDAGMLALPTSLLTKESMEHLSELPKTGGIFQEYVPKQYEIRVTVIGEEVSACRIDSQSAELEEDRVDWRRAIAIGTMKATSYDLPKAVADKCLALTKSYGLTFGAIDLIRRPDGEYVFLEINPNGQWIWVEELTGQPLIASMIKFLSRGV